MTRGLLLPLYHVLNAATLLWFSALPGVLLTSWAGDRSDRHRLLAAERRLTADQDAPVDEGTTLPIRTPRPLHLSHNQVLCTGLLVLAGVGTHALARRCGADTGALWRWFTFGRPAVPAGGAGGAGAGGPRPGAVQGLQPLQSTAAAVGRTLLSVLKRSIRFRVTDSR